MIESISKEKSLEKAVLVGITLPQESDHVTEDNLQELALLSITAGAQPLNHFSQRVEFPNPKTFIGPGKVAEIDRYCREFAIDTVIFDEELSATQIRNLERTLTNIKILDRTNLILDIFAMRAKTAQAKTQVELAQHEYILPRLTKMWTHLSRQKGGIGMKGPGEKEIETDRRIVRDKISLLKQKLHKLEKQNHTRRKSRESKVRVSLVGYTNAGKSTLMNRLAKSEVQAEDQLFATLDTTVRKVVLDRLPFLMSDTVGFIRKLPHGLVESFKSTLDEVRESDILLHVVDLSNRQYARQMDAVHQTLAEMGVADKPRLTVFNKLDAVPARNEMEREALQEHMTELVHRYGKNSTVVFISAAQKQSIDLLRDELYREVSAQYQKRYPNLVPDSYPTSA